MKILMIILFAVLALFSWVLLEKNRQENEQLMSSGIVHVNFLKTGGLYFFFIGSVVCFAGLLCQLIRDI